MMITEKDLLKYGIQSICAIAETTWKPKIIIRHLDDSTYDYFFDGLYEDTIETIYNNHINTVCIKQMRKEKLNEIH